MVLEFRFLAMVDVFFFILNSSSLQIMIYREQHKHSEMQKSREVKTSKNKHEVVLAADNENLLQAPKVKLCREGSWSLAACFLPQQHPFTLSFSFLNTHVL